MSAKGVLRTEGFRYALDNGAWSAYQQGEPFDERAFARAVDLLGGEADFVVAPDIVSAGKRSLELTLRWLPQLRHLGRVLVAVQDGIEPSDVADLLGPRTGIFLGGSTEWKTRRMRSWGDLARARGCYYHVGRVNSRRRIQMCVEAGAHSFDGTSVTRYASTIALLDAARHQRGFVW